MGVWMDLFVAPAEPRPFPYDRFEALVADLVHRQLVSLPATVLAGEVEPDAPLGMVNRTFAATQSPDLALYRGEDRDALIRGLRAAPYGERDLCVCFEGLGWDNVELRTSLESRGFSNAYVVLYALARPQTVPIVDCYQGTVVERTVQHFFTTTGKRGPRQIVGTPLEPVLQRHFGPHLMVECGYS